jgi:hypothetical protein
MFGVYCSDDVFLETALPLRVLNESDITDLANVLVTAAPKSGYDSTIDKFFTWWERLVDSLKELFGVYCSVILKRLPLPLRVLNESEIIQPQAPPQAQSFTVKYAMADLANVLVTAAPQKSGYDSMVKLCLPEVKVPLYFYNQMKLSYPKRESLEEVIAKMICYVLLYHLAEVGDDLSAVYITLYNWGDDTTEVNKEPPLDDYLLRSALDKALKNARENRGKNFEWPQNFPMRLTEFVDHYMDHVKFVGQKRMQRWLLPTLLPFPSILLNVAET